jgi:trimethylamine:corrinoid methyltransferase-like protein
MADRAKEKVTEILGSHSPEDLAGSTREQIEEIIGSFEKKVKN